MPFKDKAQKAAYMKTNFPQRESLKSKRVHLRTEYIAVDGEGVEGRYVLLADSTGRSIWRDEGLTSRECFEFLLSLQPRSIPVGFGLNYDVSCWLADLSAERRKALFKWKDCAWGRYRIKWVPRKWFELWEFDCNGECYHIREKPIRYVRIEDVMSNFEGGFEKVAEKWDPEGADQILGEGKKRRDSFTLADRSFMESYNAHECVRLVRVMRKFRAAKDAAGFRTPYHYSPAVLAKDLLQRHGAKAYIPKEEPEEAKAAYFGGRIETAAIGRTNGPIFESDITSAYPWVTADLPNFADGTWQRSAEYRPDSKYSLYHVRWDYPLLERRFWPFPWRSKKGGVYFPPCGTAWIWAPEVKAAIDSGLAVKILDGLHYTPSEPDFRPFAWVREVFAQRASLKLQGNPAEYVLKLALNSVYGAFAQREGLIRGVKPTYRAYVYAGFITSTVRARLYHHHAEAVMYATDAYYTLAPDIQTTAETSLALGGLKLELFKEGTIVQSGVYRFVPFEGEPKIAGRGWGGSEVPFDLIEGEWAAHKEKTSYRLRKRRFVGHKLAIARGKPETWKEWEVVEREVDLRSAGKKREKLPFARTWKTTPADGLVWTVPEYEGFAPTYESTPYTASRSPEEERDLADDSEDVAILESPREPVNDSPRRVRPQAEPIPPHLVSVPTG
jgi:hypothetical protein